MNNRFDFGQLVIRQSRCLLIMKYVTMTRMGLALGLLAFGSTVTRAANLLVNPSFESGNLNGWTKYGVFDLQSTNDHYYNNNNPNGAWNVDVRDGTFAGKSYGQFTGSQNLNGVYQDVATLPTSTFSANCWFHSSSQDHISGANSSWVEVQFRDGSGTTLALYRSATVTSNTNSLPMDTWVNFEVTNQLDPGTFAVTNTTQTLVAPAGTVSVRFQIVFLQSTAGVYDGGSVYYDLCTLNQLSGALPPAIGNFYPDGTVLMQGITNALRFIATSPAAITNIKVVLNDTDVSANLVITGSATSNHVSYPFLKTNQLPVLPASGGGFPYSAVITVRNNQGASATVTKNFDVFDPNNFTFEAEDYDFSPDGGITGGSFIDNPALPSSANPPANSYFQKVGALNIDYFDPNADGSHVYRSSDFAGTEVTGDLLRQKYINARVADPSINDYNVGWWDSGNFENYTHTYPTGVFNVIARMSSPGAATVTFGKVTNGWGTSSQELETIGTFSLSSGLGWGTYSWVPLSDANGNPAKLALGGTNTFRVTSGGNANVQFFMLVPANTNLPTITGIYPNGSTLMQHTNTLGFALNSAAGFNPSDISVTLAVTNSALHFVTNVTSTSGLVITGPPSSPSVSYAGLVDNAKYTVTIQAKDGNNNTATSKATFDTYNPVFAWEAEDWDHSGGGYIQPTPVDAYSGLVGFEGVDYHDANNGGGHVYRSGDTMNADAAGDVARSQYLSPNTNDYALGYFSIVSGDNEWANYTRNFPSGTYNVYARVAVGGGTSGVTLSRVTNGWGTAQQEISNLGYLTVANTGGWSTYDYVPFLNASSNLLSLTLSGTNTLRLTRTSGGDVNVNFLMLLPVQQTPQVVQLNATRNGANIVISFTTQNGFTYTVLAKTNLSDANWQTLQAIPGDGTTKAVNDPIATQRFYRVSIQ